MMREFCWSFWMVDALMLLQTADMEVPEVPKTSDSIVYDGQFLGGLLKSIREPQQEELWMAEAEMRTVQ